MPKKRFDFPEFSIINADIKINVSMKRFEKQFQRAQYHLDGQVMNDMIPFMPMRDGNFINVTRLQSAALQGSGKVIAGCAPMGRFLYEGEVMVDPVTNSPWARKGAKKVLAGRSINYDKSRHSDATGHWFDKAKEKYGQAWIKSTKEIAGGGKR